MKKYLLTKFNARSALILLLLLFSCLTPMEMQGGFIIFSTKEVSYYATMSGNDAAGIQPMDGSSPWVKVTYSSGSPTSCIYGIAEQKFKLEHVGYENNLKVYRMVTDTPQLQHLLFFEIDNDGSIKKEGLIHKYFYGNVLTLTVWCKNEPNNGNGGNNIVPHNNNNYNNNGSSTGRSSTRRTCPGCNGTGKGADQITYSPNYTGRDNSIYCSTCGRTMSAHSHHRPICRTCYGKGYVE